MKVVIDDECTACGICEDLCPEVFVMGDDKAVVKFDVVPDELQDTCREAVEECPNEAVEIRE